MKHDGTIRNCSTSVKVFHRELLCQKQSVPHCFPFYPTLTYWSILSSAILYSVPPRQEKGEKHESFAIFCPYKSGTWTLFFCSAAPSRKWNLMRSVFVLINQKTKNATPLSFAGFLPREFSCALGTSIRRAMFHERAAKKEPE